MQDELISLIARQSNIPQGKETYNEWMQRVIYSAAGRMALASLWDFQDNEDTISIQYFKKKSIVYWLLFGMFILPTGVTMLEVV